MKLSTTFVILCFFLIPVVALAGKLSDRRKQERCGRSCRSRARRPVCGTDGKTYPSRCYLMKVKECSGKAVAFHHRGQCEEVCKKAERNCAHVTATSQQFCGSDGKTYLNHCEFFNAQQCTNLQKAHNGECKGKVPEPDCKQCPAFLAGVRCVAPNPECPVDGCPDGQACCGHPCGATCTPISQDCGVCPEYEFSRSPDPNSDFCSSGCGSGTYCCDDGAGARCLAGDGNDDDPDCDVRLCASLYAPVCGTDDRTYSSDCQLNWAQRCDDSNLKVAYKGECNDSHQDNEI